jgi:hypothetical protein
MYIISALSLHGLSSFRTPMEHHTHPLGWAHPTLQNTALENCIIRLAHDTRHVGWYLICNHVPFKFIRLFYTPSTAFISYISGIPKPPLPQFTTFNFISPHTMHKPLSLKPLHCRNLWRSQLVPRRTLKDLQVLFCANDVEWIRTVGL